MRGLILVSALLLAACGGSDETAGSSESDGNSSAQGQLALQPLGAPEIQQNHIATTGCAFVPAGGGLGVLFITDGDKAYLKTNDTVAPLMKIGDAYQGGGYSATFSRSGEGKKQGAVATYDAHLTIAGGSGATVYDAAGSAQCGA